MRPILDKFEQIAGYGQHVVCILGNPLTSEFRLVDLDRPLPPEDAMRGLNERGLYFIGTIGIVRGCFRSAWDEVLGDAALFALMAAYCGHIATRATAPPKDGFVQFAERLWFLEDPRS